jgi:decaprenylphospho-beta-D-erythro-pentofuranosid-2-ulose 2-reductase
MIDGTGMPDSLLVLGAGSAIARSVVAALVERGTRDVVLAARRPDEGELFFDASDIASHATFVDKLWSEKRRIDMVLVAFGVMGARDAVDPYEDALTVATTNYLGGVSILELVASRMKQQGQGRIVVLSSAAAFLPRGGQAAYASAKAGLDSFARGLALELHGSGVEVMIVRPGFVHTPMTRDLEPGPLATTPDAVARDVVRGLERGSIIVWSPREVRLMTTAVRLLPEPLYRRVMSGR